MSRSLADLLKSEDCYERTAAKLFLDVFEAREENDENWRAAQARWEQFVAAHLLEKGTSVSEAEKNAVRELDTSVISCLESRRLGNANRLRRLLRWKR